MSNGVTASQQSYAVFSTSRIPLIIRQRRCSVFQCDNPFFPSKLKLVSNGLLKFSRCNSSDDSGENESKTLLGAFFLGKAVGEVLNERIESTVGEFLSIIGRLQAEQQNQVLAFQEEVLEKARRAKEEATREAQGLMSNSSSLGITIANGVSETTSSVSDSVISSASSPVSNPTNEDTLWGMLNKD